MSNTFDDIGPDLVNLLINNSPLGPVTGQYTSQGTTTFAPSTREPINTPDIVEVINTTPLLSYKKGEIDGKLILQGDTKIIIDHQILVDFNGAGPIVPKEGDSYLKDGRDFRVQNANPTYGGDTILFWICQLRQGIAT